ncbi:MAG TPA: hypothetical protein VK553_07125 [Candidatus Nitrosopolaris rasttigaisensis]|nr:hypothetical protein [Candidatus Nitrosopolaris rasttigaisensis]
MSEPTREAEIGEAREEIIRDWLKEYGTYPNEEEIEMEMEAMCDGGWI